MGIPLGHAFTPVLTRERHHVEFHPRGDGRVQAILRGPMNEVLYKTDAYVPRRWLDNPNDRQRFALYLTDAYRAGRNDGAREVRAPILTALGLDKE